MTGTSLKSTRIVAAATSLLFAASALAQSAPERISVRVAQAEAPAANQATHSDTAEEKTLVLELAPTTDEATDALIMRLVAEAREEEATKVSDSEASAKIKSKAVQQALKLRGSRYRYGGSSRGGFDCSGFTQYVFGKVGYQLNRVTVDQAKQGTAVAYNNMKPGDLVFSAINGDGVINHVGIYLGEGKMIHSPRTGDVVKITDITTSYWTSRFVTARRIIQ